ncbi:MAG: DUF3253 domain-containing protein [Pseudomonadota bacterium]
MTRLDHYEDALRAAMSALAEARGASSSFCPSEAARKVAQDWRPLMPEVRRLAVEMGLVATQKGVPVHPEHARGPIRLSKPK